MSSRNRDHVLFGLLAGAVSSMAIMPGAAAADPPVQDIVVTGSRPTCRLTAEQLRPAVRAFRGDRGRYAPRGTLYFEAKPGARRAGIDATRLALRIGNVRRTIALDEGRRFSLPERIGDDWEIVGACFGGGLAISPLVMSPGTSAADRLLGDLRLQCEVAWALTEQTITGGAFVEVAGACKASRLGFYANSHRRIAEAGVTSGTVVRPVPLSPDGYSYRLPIADKSLPNTARVRFRFD